MTIEHKIAEAIRAVAQRLEHTIEPSDGDPSRGAWDEMDSKVPNNPPSLLDAARALLEARENQMVTRVDWDNLRDAVSVAEI